MGRKNIELSQNLNFSVELGASAIDKEAKKVSFILSDETIVGRGWFDMKLLHGANNVILNREQILKVFYNHDSKALPIGRWENLRVEDKKLKADAIFDSEDEFAMKIFGKIERGFLESISVGVSLLKYDVKQRDKQNDLVIVKKWEIYEASVVNIPAIPNAKVGLEKFEKEQKSMTLEELQKEHPELFSEVKELGATTERERIKAIDAVLKAEFAKDFAELKFDGKSTAEQIELAQYRKMDELGKLAKEQLQKKAGEIEEDGVALGKQVLEMGLGANTSDGQSEQKELEKQKEDKEDMEFMLEGVRTNG